MQDFAVHGPYDLPIQKKANGRLLDATPAWFKAGKSEIGKMAGVYVFGIKPPRSAGYTPFYVGKATKSFSQEVFTSDKLLKYNSALMNYKRGKPVIFFVAYPRKITAGIRRAVQQIEDYFIAAGFSVNSEIENDQGTTPPPWAITGVIRGRKGRSSIRAKKFREMFGMREKQSV